MPLVGFKARNHPQQTRFSSTDEDVDDRALPSADFEKLQKRFSFSIDVAATGENAKLPRFYTKASDGLFMSWAGERVYCNPPYSSITSWVEKSWLETDASLIVMLLPANRTEQTWWQKLIEPYRDRPASPLRVEFLAGRTRFLKPNQTHIRPNERPPFGCCLCIWERTNETFLKPDLGLLPELNS